MIKVAYPFIHPQYLVHVAIKAMNNTMEEDELIPAQLAFGIMRAFILSTDLPGQKERLDAMQAVKAEINSIIAE